MNLKEYKNLEQDEQVISKIEKAKHILSKFEELRLTPAINKSEIETEYKTQLFTKLLVVDKGLKLRFDLHRTPESKTKLIDETINLQGFDEVDVLNEMIEDYLISRPEKFSYYGMTSERFLLEHKGDIHSAFGSYVRDCTGTDLYIKMNNIANLVNDIIPDLKIVNPYDNKTMDVLKKALKIKSIGVNEIEVDENFVLYLLDYEKDSQERSDMLRKQQEEAEAFRIKEEKERDERNKAWRAKQSGFGL